MTEMSHSPNPRRDANNCLIEYEVPHVEVVATENKDRKRENRTYLDNEEFSYDMSWHIRIHVPRSRRSAELR